MAKARKIAVFGSRSVGKSSLTVQYVENHFVESYYPTIENQFQKMVVIKGQEYLIEILDTAGQDEFSLMNQKYLIGVHGYLLVYSITSRSSFDLLKIMRDKILDSVGTEEIPLVVVGNKSDLYSQRQVTIEEGQNLAKEFNCSFVECSARMNENVDECFQRLIQGIESTEDSKSSTEGGESCVIM
ncbi:BA75_01875T0 [Komagataella pastoris]|uniref:BA75_01875T0 n=1 Tax=Komagataella pastoris TaxID=4922 RepID=A0A1B2JB10_PICPA|nr:BA75_01875T0 [Komagataella pastoris]